MEKVVVLVDTPNISKSVRGQYPQGTLPDYRALRQIAAKYGSVTRSCALVNDGISRYFVAKLVRRGFEVKFSHAFDCDDALIAWAVKLRRQADCMILCSGDKHYIPLVQMLIAAGMKIVVCAVGGACNRTLKRIAGLYEEMPTRPVLKQTNSLDSHNRSWSSLNPQCGLQPNVTV